MLTCILMCFASDSLQEEDMGLSGPRGLRTNQNETNVAVNKNLDLRSSY